VLQCVAVCCSALQSTCTHSTCVRLAHVNIESVAVCCSVLQCAAVRCYVLQSMCCSQRVHIEGACVERMYTSKMMRICREDALICREVDKHTRIHTHTHTHTHAHRQ